MKTLEQIVMDLEKLYDVLDALQEEEVAQNNEELMWELGEAIGAINNAIDILKKGGDR